MSIRPFMWLWQSTGKAEKRFWVYGLQIPKAQNSRWACSLISNACMDGLTEFPDAVKAVFPDTHFQHCIVHIIRNSTKFVSYKDLKAVCRDLKEVYSAINAESSHEALEEFGRKWNDKYPMIQAFWERN